MNSRERVLRAIEHKEPDRVPVALGCGSDTGIHIAAYRNLIKYLGLPDREIKAAILNQQIAVMDEDVLKKLSIDTRGVFTREPDRFKVSLIEDDMYSSYTDEFFISWRMPKTKPLYYDMYKFPLQDSTLQDLRSFKWPDGADPGRSSGLALEAEEKYRNTESAIVLGPTIGGLLETFLFLQGFEEGYYRLAMEEKYSEYLLDQLMEIKTDYWCSVLDAAGKHTNIITESDDLGFQDRLAISPAMFNKYLKPRYEKMFRLLKSKYKVYILFHSCGSIFEFIPGLINAGIDILNPVQVSAKGMETEKLKKEFGKYITFNGAIDTQVVLPHGKPSEVKEEVKRRIDHLAKDGGYLLSPVHCIQPDVPPENIVALLEAVQEYGTY